MASHSILSQLCRQEVQNPGVISAAFSWKGEPLPCRSQRLLAILGHHWLGDASPRPCLQLPMGSYTLSSGLEISLFLVELWLICIVVWQKPPQHCKAIFLQLKNKLKKNSCTRHSGSQALQELYPLVLLHVNFCSNAQVPIPKPITSLTWIQYFLHIQ